MVGARRDHGEGRHHPLGDAPVVVAVLGVAARADVEAAGALDHLEHRLHVAQVVLVALRALEQRIAVELAASAGTRRGWNRCRLPSPAASCDSCSRFDMKLRLGRHHGEFPLRQRRLLLGRAHVGPQHAAALDQRIGLQFDLLAEAALGRLRRHLDALAGVVVFPAVIGAAQPVLLVAAEPQRDAAVRAELVGQRIAALRVAPGQQPLGQQLHPHRRAFVLRQFLGEQRRAASSARNIWPIGVPGPVWVSRSFCSFRSIAGSRIVLPPCSAATAKLLKPYQPLAASVDRAAETHGL